MRCSLTDVPPIPLTPDYGSPVVSYADGIYDGRFNRFVTVMEGKQSRKNHLVVLCQNVPDVFIC